MIPKYDLIEVDGEDNWCVKIKSGDYADVVYKYNTISAVEPDTPDGYAVFKYNYEILYSAENPEEAFAGNSTFEHMLGDILVDLIDTSPEVKKEDAE